MGTEISLVYEKISIPSRSLCLYLIILTFSSERPELAADPYLFLINRSRDILPSQQNLQLEAVAANKGKERAGSWGGGR